MHPHAVNNKADPSAAAAAATVSGYSNNNGKGNNNMRQQQDDSAPPCRDFLRNVCRRGKKCKFSHEVEQEHKEEQQQQQQETGMQVNGDALISYGFSYDLRTPVTS